MTVNPKLQRLVRWLRVSYPSGVPSQDFQPLLALMRRRLTSDEIDELGHQLVADGLVPADRVDVGVEVMKVTQELPSASELDRVLTTLRGSGFPVDTDWSTLDMDPPHKP